MYTLKYTPTPEITRFQQNQDLKRLLFKAVLISVVILTIDDCVQQAYERVLDSNEPQNIITWLQLPEAF